MLYKPNVPACRAVTYQLYSKPCDGECNNNNNNDNRIHVRIHIRTCVKILLLSSRLWISRERLPPVIFHFGIFSGASSPILEIDIAFFFYYWEFFLSSDQCTFFFYYSYNYLFIVLSKSTDTNRFERHQISSDDIYVRVVVVAKKMDTNLIFLKTMSI